MGKYDLCRIAENGFGRFEPLAAGVRTSKTIPLQARFVFLVWRSIDKMGNRRDLLNANAIDRNDNDDRRAAGQNAPRPPTN
jgi:hypothetical protein